MPGSLPTLRDSLHRATRFAAGMLAGMAGIHLVSFRRVDAAVLSCVAMSLDMAITARIYQRAPDLSRIKWVARFNAVFTGLGLVVLFALTGGSGGIFFPLAIAVPLIFAIFVPLDGVTPLLNGLAIGAGCAVIMLREHRPPLEIITWLLLLGCMAVFASYGARFHNRILRQERQVETERTEALQRLAESERHRMQAARLALVGQLAAGVAHEINNPLAFVKANVRWLEQEREAGALRGEGDTARELPQVLDEALSGIARIEQIVSDLRSFAREGPTELEDLPLAETVEEALRIARVRLHGGIRVRAELPPNLPPVRGTPRRLVQVLLNLLVNAADAIETLEADRPDAERWIRLSAQSTRDAVELFVENSGESISEDVRARLFEPFFTTKGPKKGTGLGLALSREFMQRMGGALELCPGEHTRFLVRVPRAEV